MKLNVRRSCLASLSLPYASPRSALLLTLLCFPSQAQRLSVQAPSPVPYFEQKEFGFPCRLYAVDTFVNRFTAADFTGDGYLDVVGGGFYPTGPVYPNRGDGSFLPPLPNSIHRPGDLASADVDQDGNMDLVSLATSGDFTVSHGAGDGTFTLAQSTSIPGASPNLALALADLNGDGFVDVIYSLTVLQNSEIRCLLNLGDGTFDTIFLRYSLGSRPSGDFEVADLDGDGRLDLLGKADGFVSVRRNLGGVSFGPVLSYSVPDVQDIELGDVDGDGADDLVAFGSNGLQLFYGLGDGAFSASVTIPASLGSSISSVDVGDLNGDDRPDLVLAVDGVFSVLLNIDGFAFAPAAVISEAGDLTEFELLDPDLDGDLDIVAGNGSILVLENPGDADFLGMSGLFPGLDKKEPQVLADFTGSGALDVASLASDGTVTVHENLGNGTMSLLASFPTPTEAVLAADIDGDGDNDLLRRVSGCGNGCVVPLLNVGAGTFAPGPTTGLYPFTTFASWDALDYDGDGFEDFVATTYYETVVFLSVGDGTFQQGPSFGSTRPRWVATTDFDLDGDVDIASIDEPSGNPPVRVGFYRNDRIGSGSPLPTYVVPSPTSDPFLAFGDLTGDGYDDAIVREDGILTILENASGSSFDLHATYDHEFYSASAIDIDLDGDLDVVTADEQWQTLWRNDGTGFLEEAETVLGSNYPLSVDLDEDGLPDLLSSIGVLSRR